MYPHAEADGMPGRALDVTVVGSGAAGLAVATSISGKGHPVQVVNRSSRGLAELRRRKGISASWEGLFSRPTVARIERADTLTDVSELGRVLLLAIGAGAEAEVLRALGPALATVELVVVLSGQVGAGISCELVLEEMGKDLPVIEMGFPFVASETSPGAVEVYGKKEWTPLTCTPPGTWTAARGLWRALFDLDYDVVTPEWACLHAIPSLVCPLLSLFSAARIDRGEGFNFFSEGSFRQLGSLMEVLDRERQSLGEALGVATMPTLAWLNRTYGMECVSFAAALTENPAYSRVLAPASLEHRHLPDNVLLGVVPLTELGARVGVPTPTMNSVVELASALLSRDLRSEGRSCAGWVDELLGPHVIAEGASKGGRR